MRPPIDGGVVLVTGASAGIGQEFARLLGRRARGLALVARRGDRLAALAAELTGRHPELKVTVHACDLGDRAATDTMLAEVERDLGPVDVLVNNAGFGDHGFYEDSDWDKTRRMIDLNVTALAYLTRRVLSSMKARRRGGILNVSSLFGLAFLPGYAAYIGTKFFVSGFTEALRTELRGEGIVVCHACPGPVATEFEAVSGEFLGKGLPSWAMLSAEACARSTLRGFARGRALVVPGAQAKLLALLHALTPRVVLRWLGYLTAWWMRRKTAGRK